MIVVYTLNEVNNLIPLFLNDSVKSMLISHKIQDDKSINEEQNDDIRR